jgi:hypothetical protein
LEGGAVDHLESREHASLALVVLLLLAVVLGVGWFYASRVQAQRELAEEARAQAEEAARVKADGESSESVRSAAAYDGHLLCLFEGGTVGAWDLKTGAYPKETAARLSRKGLKNLAADGTKLWAADGATLYQWSAKARMWEEAVGFDVGEESLLALVPVSGSPLLVFPSKVVDPVAGRTFPVPKECGLRQGPPLRVLAVHGTDSMLWIGTGFGEWGGTLLGLDPKAGNWVHMYDFSYSVTGITTSARGEIIVSWSHSHVCQSTLVRAHRPDATVKTEYADPEGKLLPFYPGLAGKYFQCITYNPLDDTLYGVESTDLVTIKDGIPTKVVKIADRLFGVEPHAIGVAPGILTLIPTGPKSVAIIPKWGQPWQLRDGELTVLKKP